MAPRENRDNRKGSFKEVQKEFREELLGVDRVTRVTAGGRQLRFRAAVVIGNGKGRVGLGTGKAGEVVVAIDKAIRDAKKNLIDFPMVKGTIPFDVASKYKASRVYVHPASAGTGIIAGGALRKLFAVSGLKDIIAKQHGAPNKITNIRVILKALAALNANPKARALAEADRVSRPAEDAAAANVRKDAKSDTKHMVRSKAPAKKAVAEEAVVETPVEEAVVEAVETVTSTEE